MKILILCGFYHSKLRFEGGRREALREGHSERFGMDFMCFLEVFFMRVFGFWVAGGSILDLISALFGRPLVPLNVSKT